MKKDMSDLLRISEKFATNGKAEHVEPHGNGHINDTFLLICRLESGETCRYILQRMNHEVFKDPAGLMENITGVTAFLQKKIVEHGGDPARESLNVIPLKEGGSFCKEEDGTFWRMYGFVEGADSFDIVERPEDFYESAVAFGHFQKLLAEYPAESLHETIPDFHNTVKRFDAFKKAVKEGRLSVGKIIAACRKDPRLIGLFIVILSESADEAVADYFCELIETAGLQDTIRMHIFRAVFDIKSGSRFLVGRIIEKARADKWYSLPAFYETLTYGDVHVSLPIDKRMRIMEDALARRFDRYLKGRIDEFFFLAAALYAFDRGIERFQVDGDVNRRVL